MTNRLILTLICSVLAHPLVAEDVGDAARGEEIYMRYCATCHGIEGTGQGPMAAVLTLQPKNLRELSRENGGEFPLERTVKRIDGRDPLVSHGSPMPIFGDYFEGKGAMLKTDSGQPIVTSLPVADLVAYLRGVQAE